MQKTIIPFLVGKIPCDIYDENIIIIVEKLLTNIFKKIKYNLIDNIDI
jgi:hypothetical protein